MGTRGEFQDQGGLFSYVKREERILADHPLRKVRKLVREVLQSLRGRALSGLLDRKRALHLHGHAAMGCRR